MLMRWFPPFLALALLLAGGETACSVISSPRPAKVPLVEPTAFTVLQTTDLHDAANGTGPGAGPGRPGPQGSYARIAAYVEGVRASAGHPVLLVDSGDWTMGTCYDLTLHSRPLALLFLDALRYDCAALGNHEFDYGPAGLARILGAARDAFGFRTPLVASNLDAGASPELEPWVGPGRTIAPTRVQTIPNGLRIGYLGLMGRMAALEAPLAAPAAFPDFSRDYGRVQALVDDLRQGQGCQVVIALSHSGTDAAGTGGEDVDLARNVTGIDVIASGHTHHELLAATVVANGSWTTRIIGAGVSGGRVVRLDLTYHPASGAVTQDGCTSQAMTDAALAGSPPGPPADPAFTFLVGAADQQLHGGLAGLFSRLGFTDYRPADPATGLYHPVGALTGDLRGNGTDPVPGPNGLGNLCADALRALANTLDPAPVTAAAVATGVIRGALGAGAPLTFTDLYNVLPLGLSPDPGQTLPAGYPLLTAFLDRASLGQVGALQLAAQAGLIPPDFYLNLSGLRFQYREAGLEELFRAATAARVLAVTSALTPAPRSVRAAPVAKDAAAAPEAKGAAAALGALAQLPRDAGAALQAAADAGNPYASALAATRDPATGSLDTLAQVAAAARADAATGGTTLPALLVARAVAAVSGVAAFGPDDPACTGAVTALAGSGRWRMVADLYAILMLAVTREQFGTTINPCQGPEGGQVLEATPAGLAAALGNRLNLNPAGSPLVEAKGWTALLLYVRSPSGPLRQGQGAALYASAGGFTRFPSFGAAVRIRAPDYPLERIRKLNGVVANLQALPYREPQTRGADHD